MWRCCHLIHIKRCQAHFKGKSTTAAEKREQERKNGATRAARVFEGSWLLRTERELTIVLGFSMATSLRTWEHLLMPTLKCCRTSSKTTTVTLEIGAKEALAERKRACRMLGLLTEGNQNLVKSLTEPLPLAEVENN